MVSVAIFGEPLLEVCAKVAGQVLGESRIDIAGDTLNTAVYLSRLGHDVSYLTAVGRDAYSDAIIDRLGDEGVCTAGVLRHPSRSPGLYAIRTDSSGERHFTYWRDRSAAREFFTLPQAEQVVETAMQSELFYFSGISLAILSPSDRDELLGFVKRFVDSGGRVAFDSNYRPGLWQSPSVARIYIESVGKLATIVLPTADDEDLLFGSATPAEHADRWQAMGAECVVVKVGASGAWVTDDTADPTHVPVEQVTKPVDTTGAGDSFNAAFLASLLSGRTASDAAVAGNELAAEVIQRRGGLIPRTAMPPAIQLNLMEAGDGP